MDFSFRTEQWLPHPSEQVFAFFADPNNLPLLLPPWQKARIEKMILCVPPRPADNLRPAHAACGVGTKFTLSFRPLRYLPVRLRWDAEITDFTWNTCICDRQLRGPFAFWNHTHRIRAVIRADFAVTLVADQIEYALPFGPLGRLAHSLFVRRYIERMFAWRQARLAKILASAMPEIRQPLSHQAAS